MGGNNLFVKLVDDCLRKSNRDKVKAILDLREANRTLKSLFQIRDSITSSEKGTYGVNERWSLLYDIDSLIIDFISGDIIEPVFKARKKDIKRRIKKDKKK